jgi:hypothetical protein
MLMEMKKELPLVSRKERQKGLDSEKPMALPLAVTTATLSEDWKD